MPWPFIFVICQNGSESVCKHELLANHPGLKFAFSRPGFLTFKCESETLSNPFHLKSTFARSYGWSLQHCKSTDIDEQIRTLMQAEILSKAKHLHIWERDWTVPGTKGFEPGPTILAQQAGEIIMERMVIEGISVIPVNRNAGVEELIFDIVMVEPDDWWYGFHIAGSRFQRWPGGVPRIEPGDPVISRAYYKLQEALLWSGIHIHSGDVCAEIGSSPGGACQLLLEKGAEVIAIDPAELDPSIAECPGLTHLRCRGRDVPKKKLKDVRWLLSDVNAAPSFTLDIVEEIISNQHVTKVRGLILTLKLSNWTLAKQLGVWRERINQLGFQVVKSRQLAFNRREVCMIAVRDRFALRESRKTPSRTVG